METVAFSVRILEPGKIKIFRDEHGNLKLKIEGETEYQIQRVVRVFPITMPWNYIAFKDVNDREIGILRSVNELDKDSAQVLKEELEKTYFIPKITKIYDIKDNFGVFVWRTKTNKGPRTFEVVSREDIKKISIDRVLIKDGDGNLYDIPNIKNLDKRSLILLDSVI